jgi:hypothetical protein
VFNHKKKANNTHITTAEKSGSQRWWYWWHAFASYISGSCARIYHLSFGPMKKKVFLCAAVFGTPVL